MSTIAKFFVDKHWKSKLKLFLGFFLQAPATELTVVLFFFLFFSLSLSLSLVRARNTILNVRTRKMDALLQVDYNILKYIRVPR